jgi:hypothetical protein
METVKHPISDRVFTFCGFEPYQRKDGSWTELKVWETMCKTCKQSFRMTTPKGVKGYMDSNNFQLVNCPQHRGK